MMSTAGTQRANRSKEKQNKTQTQTNVIKSPGPPQATQEQMRIAQMITASDGDDTELQQKIKQVVELTGRSEDQAAVALHDCYGDPNRAVNTLLEGDADKGQWETSGKKKKPKSQQAAVSTTKSSPDTNHVGKEGRPDRGEGRPEKSRDRGSSEREMSNSRGRNIAPRFARGGKTWQAKENEFNERNEQRNFSDFSDRPERGRGRGSGRGGRGRSGGRIGTWKGEDRRGGGGGRGGGGAFSKPIDTWTNSSVTENSTNSTTTNVGNWSNDMANDIEDWGTEEDWTGSLSESKVFTPSGTSNLPDNERLGKSIDLDSILPMKASSVSEHSAINTQSQMMNQFNTQVATETIKSAVGLVNSTSSSMNETWATPQPHRTSVHSSPQSTGLLIEGSQSPQQQQQSVTGGQQPGQQRGPATKAQKTRLPPPSKIPQTAVEMPGNRKVDELDVQFGALEFGVDEYPPYSSAVPGAITATNTFSASSVSAASMAQQLSKPSDVPSTVISSAMMAGTAAQKQSALGGLDANRKSYRGPALPSTGVSSTKDMSQQKQMAPSGPDPILMPSQTKPSSLLPNQRPSQVQPVENSLSKTETLSSSYASSSAYQSGYQVHKSSGYSNQGYGSQTQSGYGSQTGVYPSSNQYGGQQPSYQGVSSGSGSFSGQVTSPYQHQIGSSHYQSQSQISSPYQSQTHSYTMQGQPGSYQTSPQAAYSSSAYGQSAAHNMSAYPNQTYQSSGQSFSGTTYQSQNSNFGSSAYNSNSQIPSVKLGVSMSSTGKEASLDTTNQVANGSSVNSVVSATSVTSAPSTLSLAGAITTQSTSAKMSSLATGKVPANLPPGVPATALLGGHQYIMSQAAGLPFYGLQQPLYSYEDLQLLQQHHGRPAAAMLPSYYDMSSLQVPSTVTGRDGTLTAAAFAGSDGKMNRGDQNTSPVPSTLSQQQHQQQQYINAATALPPGYPGYYYTGGLMPSGYTQYGTPLFPASAALVPPVTNTHGATTNAQYQKPATYGSHNYNSGYEDLAQVQEYAKATAYAGSSAAQSKVSGSTGTGSNSAADLSQQINAASAYSKHATQFDKQGFHTGTPPPFNMTHLAAGGAATGPIGVGTTAYPAPFMPVMTHHHSPMLHGHHLQQDGQTGSTQRATQNAVPQKVSAGKPYNSTGYWGAN